MFTVLWDNDGVLVDTEALYFDACRTVLRTVDVDLTAEQFRDISLRKGESTLDLAAGHGASAEEIACLRAQRDRLYAQSLATQSCTIAGAEEVLRSLYGRVRMGVVTSTPRSHFEIAHARSGLTPFLDFVIAREDYRNSKPDPEPYLTALRRHGLRPEQCVVVEDSPRGLASATAAGLRCLVLLSRWTTAANFHGAWKVLRSIYDVPEAVLTLSRDG